MRHNKLPHDGHQKANPQRDINGAKSCRAPGRLCPLPTAGDLFEVVPALTEVVKKVKSRFYAP